jgi:tetratricopeptide (TPR) repeat protein
MGYIYGDDSDNSDAKIRDYQKAEDCYEECLKIDKKNKNIFIIHNDLGYLKMLRAQKVKDVKEKERLYNISMTFFENSIECIKEQNIKWPNPYKNKGYCLGKLAALKSGQEQLELYIRASVMYQRAFALNKNPKMVEKSFDKTLKDFLSKYKWSVSKPR